MDMHEKIRTLRELNQWTQEEMAEKLEMSTGGYAKIERGDSQPNLARLGQIAKVFNINVLELLQHDKGLVIQLNDEVNGNNNHVSFYATTADMSVELEKLQLMIQHKNELLAQKDELLAQKTEENNLLKDMISILKSQLKQ